MSPLLRHVSHYVDPIQGQVIQEKEVQQITVVDQRAENFGVVATLLMQWRDPALAFNPETVQDRYQIFEGDTFSQEMGKRGQPWPQYTIINQQGKRWVQNRVVIVKPDGAAFYLERFSGPQ